MIVLFAKYPEAGRVKTRLIPALGATRAMRLHRRLTEVALGTAQSTNMAVTVSGTGAATRRFRHWLGGGVRLEQQTAGDLGCRMEATFARVLSEGSDVVLGIGADVPGITAALLEEARQALQQYDVVLGPAQDGGYYLIGMRRLHRELFHDIAWGSATVLEQTLARIHQAGLRCFSLPTRSDVDRAQDLELVRRDGRLQDVLEDPPRLSVIIPARNEEAHVGPVIQAVVHAPNTEVLLVDGGSTDRTREVAAAAGANVRTVAGGRARQQNAGAEGATGQRFLFLHADTRVPQHVAGVVHAALDLPEVVLGAFRFSTDRSGWAMKCVETGTNFRSRVRRLPYGDQGLFMERRVFDALGRFPEQSLMEDYALVRKARARGRVLTVPAACVTSARRWDRLGVWRTMWRNQVVIAGYHLGVPPERLRAYYKR